jgi:hypothetical protein
MVKASALKSNVFRFIFVTLIVFFSRLPFLLPGYGTDPDAWGVVYVSRQFASTGEYQVSRFPGSPVQESITSLIWEGGPLVLNGLTSLFSGVSAAFLTFSMRRLGYRKPILASLGFALTPVVFINSVNTMDYMWATTFILGGLYLLLIDKTSIGGLFLGIAIGCRLSSVIMLLPLGFLLLVRTRKLKELLKFVMIASSVGGLAFLPAYRIYGFKLFKLTDINSIPIERILTISTIGVWGVLGLIALGIGGGYILIDLIKRRDFHLSAQQRPYLSIWILSIVLYTVIFLWHPHESGYLVTTVPFLIMVLSEVLNRKVFIFVVVGFLFSSLCLGMHSDKPTYFPNPEIKLLNYSIQGDLFHRRFYIAPFYGPILFDHSQRVYEMQRLEKIISFANKLDKNSVVVTGWHLPKFAELTYKIESLVDYVWLLDEEHIQSYREDGFDIYFLPEMLKVNREVFDVDLQEFGGRPILVTDEF